MGVSRGGFSGGHKSQSGVKNMLPKIPFQNKNIHQEILLFAWPPQNNTSCSRNWIDKERVLSAVILRV